VNRKLPASKIWPAIALIAALLHLGLALPDLTGGSSAAPKERPASAHAFAEALPGLRSEIRDRAASLSLGLLRLLDEPGDAALPAVAEANPRHGRAQRLPLASATSIADRRPREVTARAPPEASAPV
jgi:hypothetical protein